MLNWIQWRLNRENYKDISDWHIKLIDTFLENPKLTKLLYYTDFAPLEQPDLTPKQLKEVYRRHIIPSKPSTFQSSDPVTSIYFYLDDVTESWFFIEGKLVVKIITPHHLINIKEGTRNMLLAQEIVNSTHSISFFFVHGLNFEKQDQKDTFEGDYDLIELHDHHVQIPKNSSCLRGSF